MEMYVGVEQALSINLLCGIKCFRALVEYHHVYHVVLES